MEELLKQLIEKSKTNRKVFNQIKNVAITLGEFELASQLREMELEAFPETEEVKQMRIEIKQLTRTFALMGMTLDDHTSWLVNETVKLYNQKGGELSLEDATKLLTLRDQLYPKS